MKVKKGAKESKRRSLAKAISYRILIVLLDGVAVYLLTRRVDIALGFVIIRNVYSALAYYGHERLWNRLDWGRG